MLRVERSLLVVALLFIIIIAVKMTSYLVSLLLMSLIITLLALPSLLWLKERGLPNIWAVMIVTLGACLVILAFMALTALSLNTLVTDLPQYQQDFNMRISEIISLLAPLGITSLAVSSFSFDINEILSILMQFTSVGVAGVMTVMDGVVFLFFVAVTSFFLLLDATRINERFDKRFGKNSHTMRQISKMIGYITDFIVVRTETNLIHGVLFGGFLSVMGVHSALLWGILTFLLGYIPYFGLIIAAIPALFFAWLQFGIPGVVAVVVVIGILNLVIENPVYSFLAARKFEMPALIVIVSVIFWGWLLGLVGMLFSIPFTLILLLIIQMSEETRWINDALGVGHLFEERCEK